MANDASKMTTHDDVQHTTSETSPVSDDDPSRSPEAQPSISTFSVAQALSMVRRRREEQERSRREQEELLEEQRREKAKEKRQRRRKNQKEKRAKLRENANANVLPSPFVTCDLESSENGRAINEATDNQAHETKRPLDHEIVDGINPGMEDVVDEIDIKKLPVKKRLRLDSSRKGAYPKAATTSTPAEVITTEASAAEATTTESAIALTSTTNHRNEGSQSTTTFKKVTSLVPRALLLKMPRR